MKKPTHGMDSLMNDVKDQGGGMNELELRVLKLEHQALQAKDQIIGTLARNGELLHRLAIAQKNNKKLREEVQLIHSSTAWRIGRLLLSPVRTLKLIFRKLKKLF